MWICVKMHYIKKYLIIDHRMSFPMLIRDDVTPYFNQSQRPIYVIVTDRLFVLNIHNIHHCVMMVRGSLQTQGIMYRNFRLSQCQSGAATNYGVQDRAHRKIWRPTVNNDIYVLTPDVYSSTGFDMNSDLFSRSSNLGNRKWKFRHFSKFYKHLESPNLAPIAKLDKIVKIGGYTQLIRWNIVVVCHGDIDAANS